MKPTELLHSASGVPTCLTELLNKATSTHELPEAMFARDGGLSDEKAILLIMRHLEDFRVPSSDIK
jgi:hypothetical protein